MKRAITQCMRMYLGVVLSLISLHSLAYTSKDTKDTDPYNAWLKAEFSQQHEQLIPVVAVADMYYSCNKQRDVVADNLTVKELVLTIEREVLANKLNTCLGDDSVKSDRAINFGLTTCFQEQLSDLPADEQQQKMLIVENAIQTLSRSERQKSFTQCVNDQAIKYLK